MLKHSITTVYSSKEDINISIILLKKNYRHYLDFIHFSTNVYFYGPISKPKDHISLVIMSRSSLLSCESS